MDNPSIFINTELTDSFASTEVFNNYFDRATEAYKTLLSGNGEGNDFLGWVDLPQTLSNDIINRIHDDVHRLSSKCKLFVVIGIGGSYLGARAVIEALQNELEMLSHSSSSPLIIYAGHTLSEEYYAQLLPLLDQYDYGIAVISKSGTTTEPAIAFRMLKHHLEQKYGIGEARQRIIAITDANRGALHNLALQEGYSQYVIPDNVGGRFSVFTPVGLLPIAMAGFNIDKLLSGAQTMQEHCRNAQPYQNRALQYASRRQALYAQGYKVEVLASFLPQLRYISEWWKQLYGESEGKEGKGILPHSLCYTTDLHSMGQYMQEGERMIFETFIRVDKSQSSVTIPSDSQDLDGINYLCGKSLTQINHCAEQGTIEAHHDGGVPILQLQLPTINEQTLGELLYFFEFACGVSGYIEKVNPFNQPGVEAYKKNMFRLLGKK
ncbi:MAG: glucose-6-phosphate isomerase [Bacteroidales bacterium]|nr:glucose-6-phosphate isomerase [Candidatus Colimorpha onthohippi]